MRKSVWVFGLFALLGGLSMAANAEDVDVAFDCAQVSVAGEQQMMNVPLGMPEPDLAQIPIPQCNCTRPGTTVPPGQLGIKCASPIGGPIRTCRAVVCFTSITTPWINGVCQ